MTIQRRIDSLVSLPSIPSVWFAVSMAAICASLWSVSCLLWLAS
jgi:hypothetical protein